MIIDSIKTNEQRQLSVYRENLPIPLLNPACGADWKNAIYIVGGECEGQPSQLAYKFNLRNFGFEILKDLEDSHLSMAALSTVKFIDLTNQEELKQQEGSKVQLADS